MCWKSVRWHAQHMIDSLLYRKLPPHFKRSLKLAYLENGTNDQIGAYLERELELSGLKNNGELTIATMTAVPQMTINKTLNKLKLYATFVKNQATLSEIVVKRWERNKSKEMILQPKTRNLRHLNHLHHVLIVNEQTIVRKNVGVVPMRQIDPNGSNRSIQLVMEMMGKNKETCPTQDLHQFSKFL